MVLFGKTGVGKSASGDTILGREAFESYLTPSSVTTECKKEKAEVNGRDVYVVDTPGLFDTNYTEELIKKEITKCICLSSPGPHVFLVVIQLGRFTVEEQETVKWIKTIFGEESAKYTMVLFSYGDKLKKTTIEEYLSQSKELKEFIAQCLGGYHVFNNEDPKNRSQVTELLQKIDKMVEVDEGDYYTTEMYKQAEAEIEQKTANILKEMEEKRKREEERLMQQIEDKEKLVKAIEKLRKMQEEKARLQAELDNEFMRRGATVGAITGAVAGLVIAGPVGAGVGAVVGAAGGAGVGAKKNGQCPIQ